MSFSKDEKKMLSLRNGENCIELEGKCHHTQYNNIPSFRDS
jgi:hypothetical protein